MENIPEQDTGLAGTLHGTTSSRLHNTFTKREKASAKFWELEKRIKQDKKSPGVLIDMRRSTAINNIVNMVLDEVISLDDLEAFSDDLKEKVKFMVKKW